VAIVDKELKDATSFTLRMFELCTMCGARFGIGYDGARNSDAQITDETEELPRKLIEILAKDHRQNRRTSALLSWYLGGRIGNVDAPNASLR